MLFGKVRVDLNQAVKEKDQDALRTLRFLLSEINNLVIAKYPPEKGGPPECGATDEDVISVVQKLVKTHKESIEAFQKGGRQDLVDKEKAELLILQKYLPDQLSEEEIRRTVAAIKGTGLTDFGQIMKEVMVKVKGQADGAVVARIVKECSQV